MAPPRQVPLLVFATQEQRALLPLAPEPFDRPTWARCTVHPDHQLRLEQTGFEETATFEQIVWDSPVSFDRARAGEPLPAGERHLLRSRRRG